MAAKLITETIIELREVVELIYITILAIKC